jgi:hypothetical protein
MIFCLHDENCAEIKAVMNKTSFAGILYYIGL